MHPVQRLEGPRFTLSKHWKVFNSCPKTGRFLINPVQRLEGPRFTLSKDWNVLNSLYPKTGRF